MKIEIINNSNNPLPEYKTKDSAGMDLRADIGAPITLKPMERMLIPTGLHMKIPRGYEGQVRARSGLALNHGISLVNGIGTIDADYSGDIGVVLINLSSSNFVINPGDRIAQLVMSKVEQVELIEVTQLDNTARGKGGFGSTGIK